MLGVLIDTPVDEALRAVADRAAELPARAQANLLHDLADVLQQLHQTEMERPVALAQRHDFWKRLNKA